MKAVACIATAFPGLFSYKDLLNLDARDFAWWHKKAKVNGLKKQLTALGTMRLAMHGDETYERQVYGLADQIELLETPRLTDEEVINNWEERMAELKTALKRIKGKQGG